ncbi:MAG TPA: dienelactone hydrolase family protein [Xanthobacteraceae bacterium]|jgi:dienelactone hydrolase
MMRLAPWTAGLGLALALGVGVVEAGALIEFANVSERAKPARLLGYLARPDGEGPFPAVVLLHGCAGFFGTMPTLADRLKSWGYATLAVDSLGPRGITDRCGAQFIEQANDAYAALNYLSRQPFIDPGRVAVLGFSMGGGSALDVVEHGAINQLFPGKFAAAIAYYPWCSGRSAMVDTPTMILIGEADDWTSAVACREMVARPHADGAPVDLIVYPGAHHAFNFPEWQPGTRQFGHWIEYDEAAAKDAEAKLRGFLAVHLGGTFSGQPTPK